MKHICTINTTLPTIEDRIQYTSDSSLSDYDIVILDTELPYLSRIDFTGGGSCVAIEDSRRISKAMIHWCQEIKAAIISGKTVFILLNSHTTDSFAVGSTTPRKDARTYNTTAMNNYDQLLPIALDLRNARGRRFKVIESSFRGLYEAIKDISQYKVLSKIS